MDTLTNWWVSGHRLNLVQRLSDLHSHLHGESAKRDGKPIITSPIIRTQWVDHGVVLATTKSGNEYRLDWAKADPAYRQWIKEEQAKEQAEVPFV